jgi:hypothetical protein
MNTDAYHAYVLEIEWSRERSTDPALPPLVGPFSTRTEAQEWAALNIPNGSWNVAPLAYPYYRSDRSP